MSSRTPRSSILRAAAGGFGMGMADLVPGVSGGTVALVIGIYDRLVSNVREGAGVLSSVIRFEFGSARERFRTIEWGFLLPLFAGILTAVFSLATLLDHLLETQPVTMSAVFLGLVVGACVVATDELEAYTPRTLLIMTGTAIAVFLLLGLRSGRIDDPSLPILFAGGAVAIVAMILPGISGSFILLLIGLYDPLIDAASAREILPLAVFAVGAAVGLGSFSTFLNWLLRRHREPMVAALIGLMLGSLRVLWPWPSGADGVGDTRLGSAPNVGALLTGLAAAVVAALVVILVAWLTRAPGDLDEAAEAAERDTPLDAAETDPDAGYRPAGPRQK